MDEGLVGEEKAGMLLEHFPSPHSLPPLQWWGAGRDTIVYLLSRAASFYS